MEHVGAQTQPARKKYFFFDIDGTLTTENPGGIVPKSTIRTLESVACQGTLCLHCHWTQPSQGFGVYQGARVR